MSPQSQLGFVQRASYDGALCTVRCRLGEGEIPGTKGEWLGVEWDDPRRGKHNGTFNGQKYFECKSSHSTCASFIRPSRRPDPEITVLDAIEHKYGGGVGSSVSADIVVISGKVAEEVGFDKIAKEQSMLGDLRVVVIDKAVVLGLSGRGATQGAIHTARAEFAKTCPNIEELDLGYNPIEDWQDIEDICAALPKLKTLKLNGLRWRPRTSRVSDIDVSAFHNIQELHLNECLLTPAEALQILYTTSGPRFPKLTTLWLSQCEMTAFTARDVYDNVRLETIQSLYLENNYFTSLESLHDILRVFPRLKHVSFQSNHIETVGLSSLVNNSDAINHSLHGLQSINLSQNRIKTFHFVDELNAVLPKVPSLRISKNPLYDTATSETAVSPADTSYYLTLARLPALKTLNYTSITAREREEGEIYYLAVAEKDIRSVLSDIESTNLPARVRAVDEFKEKYPQYQTLCEKYDRESILAALSSPSDSQAVSRMLQQDIKQTHAPGSVASRVVNAKFYIPSLATTTLNGMYPRDSTRAPASASNKATSTQIFTRLLPITIATTHIFALIARELTLPPLQFRLIYESNELDPVRDDLSTRSQLNKGTTVSTTNSSKATTQDEKMHGRWDDWGNWDVDHLVDAVDENGEKHSTPTTASAPVSTTPTNQQKDTNEDFDREYWTAEGHLVRNGKKWKKREVEILMSLRAWGDWLDLESRDLGPNGRTVVLRVEPFQNSG